MIDTRFHVRAERAGPVTETARGLEAGLGAERLRVDLVADDVVRFAISRGGAFDDAPTFAVCADPFAAPVSFTVEHGEHAGDAVRLRTAAMTVTVGLDPFRLDVHRADGTPVVETAEDADGLPWAYATLNDTFTLRRRCRREDALYGLGEKTGRQNRKGRDLTLWNTDVLNADATAEFTAGYPPGDPRGDRTSTAFDPYYLSIPMLLHAASPGGRAAGSFLDNGYRAVYELSPAEEYRIHVAGGHYVEYVFAGPAIPDIVAAYTGLTGRIAPPPLWALGYHQCRWFDYTQEAVEGIAARHRAEEIPCDGLWLDIEYMSGYRVFTWDTAKFPDPPGMLARLGEQGFRVVTIIDPGVKHEPGYPVYDEAVERDVLCRTESGEEYRGEVWPGPTVFPDFVTPEARAWWGERNAAHVRSGLAGIWNDMNEPATGAIPSGAMRFDRGRAPHARYHNQYALLMAMATVDGLRAELPELRPFVLSRAGSAGIQRYAANWLGDNLSTWDHLWQSIPMTTGLGLSGQPFAGADVGGFHGHASAELFLRWMQYGALTPFCRNHSEIGNVDQYAWAFGPLIRDLVRDAIRLRYRLLPYLYAAFLTAAETGAPVQRPLVFGYQYDPVAAELDDQYLLGPDLLVAPVIAAGATARHVYLPAGRWYDWHTGEPHDGGRFLLVPTPRDRIPLYARGGAVIPMWPDAPPSTAGYHPDVIELHVFVPGADGTHTSLLQEDDGVTTSGARYRTTLTLTRAGDRVTLRGETTGDGYPEFARTAFRVVPHGAATDEPRVLPDAGAGFTVEFDLRGGPDG